MRCCTKLGEDAGRAKKLRRKGGNVHYLKLRGNGPPEDWKEAGRDLSFVEEL